MRLWRGLRIALLALLALPSSQPRAQTPAAPPQLTPCRLSGLSHEALCGTVHRPLDPTQPAARQIDVHFAVLPALARNKLPDPIFFFAGGPGQSAMELAGAVSGLFARASNRRDIVLIDQRGVGRSAPLRCAEDTPTRPLAESLDAARQLALITACRDALMKLPYGDLRQFTTSIAMQDAEAVRVALGVAQVNVVGGSYGTRAVLEYMRQFPRSVRRAVIDGVAPPDMVLPAAFSRDNQSALDAVFAACDGDAQCRERYPALRAQWQAMLTSLPRRVTLTHPVTGREESVLLTRDGVLNMVRQPLYAPALASALPLAVTEAAQGRFAALMGLGLSLNSGRRGKDLAQGMHYSVVCAEDTPRIESSTDKPGADFGVDFAEFYRKVCADWPRGAVPEAFYAVAQTNSPTLVLSGGIDPVTPPRHGQRVAEALGAKARHIVVPEAGHGVMSIGCMRDVMFRFIDAPDDDAAARVDASCAQRMPRPPAYRAARAEAAR